MTETETKFIEMPSTPTPPTPTSTTTITWVPQRGRPAKYRCLIPGEGEFIRSSRKPKPPRPPRPPRVKKPRKPRVHKPVVLTPAEKEKRKVYMASYRRTQKDKMKRLEAEVRRLQPPVASTPTPTPTTTPAVDEK